MFHTHTNDRGQSNEPFDVHLSTGNVLDPELVELGNLLEEEKRAGREKGGQHQPRPDVLHSRPADGEIVGAAAETAAWQHLKPTEGRKEPGRYLGLLRVCADLEKKPEHGQHQQICPGSETTLSAASFLKLAHLLIAGKHESAD